MFFSVSCSARPTTADRIVDETSTAPTGTVPIEWTWDELRYRFVVKAPDFLPLVREVNRTPGTTVDLGVPTLDPGETLRGVVRRPDGSPLSGVGVRLPRFAAARVTGCDGSFAISGLPAEPVEIEMRDPRFLRSSGCGRRTRTGTRRHAGA